MENDNGIRASGFVIQPRLHFKQAIDKMLYQYFIDAANYKPSDQCNRGQLITSMKVLSENTGWSYGVIRGIVKRLCSQGYIEQETLSQKRGIRITIVDYDNIQSLENYKKINKQDNNQTNKEINKQDNKQDDCEKPVETRGESVSDHGANKETNKEINKQDNKQINNTITSFRNIIINSNINIKEHLKDLPSKVVNIDCDEEVQAFVDFAEQVNPTGLNPKIVVNYFNTIRMTRTTCKISANILANLLDKFSKYEVDQLHYALLVHALEHDDKRESYTLGILRNTDVHEARRKLIKIKNKHAGEAMVSESSGRSDRGEYQYGF
ncbi:hypothetical protein [Desertibacillus haloalkaliphilus]|uniref:hypothetical protein n=1 Tax=Desertibacillus haloalkaliphilus TaxID=1328930 RepID=UPI001C27014B|nr:hypothetical protein [Desertibacillus haloalkaliphilus]MBU8908542.1 hypothetical protein [Desertibacillus haloalkaliphilus]